MHSNAIKMIARTPEKDDERDINIIYIKIVYILYLMVYTHLKINMYHPTRSPAEKHLISLCVKYTIQYISLQINKQLNENIFSQIHLRLQIYRYF